jgi:von Willebrand factor type A domain
MKSCSTEPTAMLRAFFVLMGTVCVALTPHISLGTDEDGIALAIVYDTSGSMKQPVQTADGKQAAKWIVGNRALEQIIQRVERFATNCNPPKTIHAGLFIFKGNGAAEAVKFGPFKPDAMRDWVKQYRGPDSGTPLGITIETASRALMSSKFTAKHILVVTDGINTSGPDPAVVVPKINKASESKGSPIFIHFVAFDIDAKVFAPLKKLGVTVVGAVDEKQLGQQLELILEEKILLEKEPAKK